MADSIKKYGEKTTKADGDVYVNSETKREYVGFGNSRKDSDLLKRPMFKSGTAKVTAGGGDITVSLGFDWSDGYLVVIFSSASNGWVETGNYFKYETSYSALTSATYAAAHVISYFIGGNPSQFTKTTNQMNLPKSATTTSFTLDDDGANTRYIKWFIWS